MPTQKEHDDFLRQRTEIRGFDPDVQEFELHNFFTFEEMKNSLFGSTRTNPIPVFLKEEDDDKSKIPVVIDLIRPSYIPELVGHEDYPDWYCEGWVVPSGYIPDLTFQRVRMYVFTLGEHEFTSSDFLHWQWIEKPVQAIPPDASLRKLKLKGRTCSLFRRPDLLTIEDVIEFAKRHEFSEIPGFGPGLLEDLRQKMAAVGYELP